MPVSETVTVERYTDWSGPSCSVSPNATAPTTSVAKNAASASLKWRRVKGVSTRVVSVAVEPEGQERQLNIHIDPQYLGGVYANFANVSFSDYEFTITFARIDHEVEEGDMPGVVVSRVNMSTKFMNELVAAMNDAWSKWATREGIKNLPETEDR